MTTTIICHGCHTVGAVNRVTAGLRCTCGSTDLDVYDPGAQSFLEYMGAAHGPGTGWGKTMPDPLRGANEYAGPAPGANPYAVDKGPQRCRECEGSGYDALDRGKCRACKGTGLKTPMTSDEGRTPQVAKHPGQTTVPFMGQRRQAGRPKKDSSAPPTNQEVIKATTPGFGERGQTPPKNKDFRWDDSTTHYPGADSHSPHVRTRPEHDYSDEALAKTAPYPMHDAPCPSCGHAPTHLVKDGTDAQDGWWHCPNCGPLANIDKHPEIDPYAEHGENFTPDRSYVAPGTKKASKSPKRTSRALAMIAAVGRTNPGLQQREVVGLVLQTIQRYQG